MEEKNYIANFDCSLWQIDDWGLYTTKSPIYINSLGGDFNAWFDVDGESFPTDKQFVAWAEFCNINSNEIKEMMIDGLTKLVTRVRDKEHHKKLNRQLEKVADSFGNITDI